MDVGSALCVVPLVVPARCYFASHFFNWLFGLLLGHRHLGLSGLDDFVHWSLHGEGLLGGFLAEHLFNDYNSNNQM